MAQFYGAILLSHGLAATALVKPDGCPAWCFPLGGTGRDTGKQAAASVVESQTGLKVAQRLDDEFLEAEFPEGTGNIARLYIAHGLAKNTLRPRRDAQISEAQWVPLSELLELPEGTSSQAHPVFPFMSKLKEFISRRHELRSDFADPKQFGKLCVFSKDRWVGPLPSHLLKSLMEQSELPTPAFNTFELQAAPTFLASGKALSPLVCATCTLPHLGVQITPEVSYRDSELAMENAALAAICFLEDSVDSNTCGIDVTGCGFFPPPKHGWNEEDERFNSIRREATAVAGGGSHYQGNEQLLDPAAYHRAKKHKPRPSNSPHTKNEIQLIKEMCDAAKWMQPTYEYERRGLGIFVCSISLANAGIESLEGPQECTQKLAKLGAARLCLKQLIEDGYYDPQTGGPTQQFRA